MNKALRWMRRKFATRTVVQTVYEPSEVLDNRLLAERTALVTGAAHNIGRAIAIELAKQGASVVAVDIDASGLDELKDVMPEGTDLKTFVADVGSEKAIDGLVDDLDASGVVVDVLVNNVGVHVDIPHSLAGDFESWRRSLEVNLVGPYRLTRKIAERLIERKMSGSVVFISSIHQWHVRGHPAYSASKAGVGLVVKELADELAGFAIRVNGIAPGAVAELEDGKLRFVEHIPLHQTPIPPRYIGRAVVCLASDYFSRHTTGATLLIDSGLLARGFRVGNSREALKRGEV